MEIVLASASLRRKELLKKILKEFEVIPAHIDENIAVGQYEPSKLAEILAFKKAEIIAKKHPKKLVPSIIVPDNLIDETHHNLESRPFNIYHIFLSV